MRKIKKATVGPDEGYLSARNAAAFIDSTPGTLAQRRFHKLRHTIPYIKIGGGDRGGRVYYKKSDLIAFMERNRVSVG